MTTFETTSAVLHGRRSRTFARRSGAARFLFASGILRVTTFHARRHIRATLTARRVFVTIEKNETNAIKHYWIQIASGFNSKSRRNEYANVVSPANCSLITSKLAIFVATWVIIFRSQETRVAFLVAFDSQITAERFFWFWETASRFGLQNLPDGSQAARRKSLWKKKSKSIKSRA